MVPIDRAPEAVDLEELARLLGPANPAEFVSKTASGDALLLDPTARPRIDVDLGELDRALASIRVTPGRVRVVKDGHPGRPLEEAVSPGDVTPGGPAPFLRLSAPALAEALEGGGTLIVNSVDELLPNVDIALRALERALGSYQGFANLYATWGSARGFDLHVDDHDTCIVQISGAKQWFLFSRDADVHTLQNSSIETIRQCEHLEHVVDVREGCLLYLPRGVPHLALPLDGHSFHITLGYRRPTAADFLRWVLTQPEASGLATSLVHAEGGAVVSLLSTVSERETDLIKRFLAAIADASRGRPDIRLFSSTAQPANSPTRTTYQGANYE
jgi:hypothetical protein